MNDIPLEDKKTLLQERREKIGKRIADERRQKGLTQEKLAERLSAMLDDGEDCKNIAQTTISSWEGGKTLPSLGKFLAMSQIFECDCGYLLCDYDKKTHNALEMCRETGLSESSIRNLCFLNQWGLKDTATVIDFLLLDNSEYYSGHDFRSILDLLHFFLSYDDKQAIQKQVFTNGAFADIPRNQKTISANSIRINQRIIENAILNEIQQALISIKKKRLDTMQEGSNGKR